MNYLGKFKQFNNFSKNLSSSSFLKQQVTINSINHIYTTKRLKNFQYYLAGIKMFLHSE